MKRQIRFIALMTVVCVLSAFSFCVTASGDVQIKGKSLGSISDIVKETTGSEFPEIPKHSLMLYERFTLNSNYIRYQPRVFTINTDGSLKQSHSSLLSTTDLPYKPVNPTSNVVQKMNVSISPKRFGTRRNVAYTLAGLNIDGGNPSSIGGFSTVESTGTWDNVSMKSPELKTPYWILRARNTWGNAHLTIKGMEGKDVFAFIHSDRMAPSGSLYVYFLGVDRNETGTVSSNRVDVSGGDRILGSKLWDYTRGIQACDIAAGDFDGDGYKNEFVVAWNNNNGVYAYVYKVSSTDGKTVSVTRIMPETFVHGSETWGIDYTQQASLAALAGDFDGDGVEEAAVVTRTNGTSVSDMRVKVFKYNKDSNIWASDELDAYNDFCGTLKATKADLNGDGQDEIVILVNQAVNGTVYIRFEIYPRLEVWSFNRGSIKPVRNEQYNKGGAYDTSLLGYYMTGDVYDYYYKTAEDFSITAGPLTGTVGHIKLADDIAISHVNSDASRVFVIPSVLNANRDFIAFGETKRIYNVQGSDYARRGAIVTGDFANEALMLDKPTHTFDDHDMSYAVVLQAMPYHVDNVSYMDGSLTDGPINYTFSGFEGDEGNGKMKVAYAKASSISTTKDVSFGMASTTETISILGGAGEFVHGYLKFQTMGANILGNFDARIKTAASVTNSILDFFTDKVDKTTTNATKESNQTTVAETMDALIWDRLLSYSARQHIWRYKILNDPLPSWFKTGPKADNSTKELQSESKEHYITFSMYDSVTPSKTPSDRNNTYQARHEEGNLFSYPSSLEEIEGYNRNGELAADPAWIAWTKGSESSTIINFEQSKIDSQKYEEEVHKSELTKIVSAIKSFFGAEDSAPPYTSHSETFQKSLSEAEQIDIELYGRSTIPGEQAGHSIRTMPFIAREGTLKVAHAVRLDDSISMRNISRLWGDDSRYRKYADPSLVLPMKYTRNGATLISNIYNASAMRIRGLRFYVPALDLDSDTNLVAGLTYEIRVPIYNASFKDTGNFSMKLSYALAGEFNTSNPEKTMNVLKEIQTLNNVSLKGWADNKDWAVFTWKIPESMATGDYIFFVQIDPEGKLEEVHDSRIDYSTGNTIDVGGNNDGYFHFNVTSLSDVEKKNSTRAAIMAGSVKPEHSDGVLFSTLYRKGQGAVNGSTVRPAIEIEDREGKIKADIKFADLESDEDNVSFIMLLGLLADSFDISPDKTVTFECSIRYDGDEYYPEAYLNGINLKPGVLEQAGEGFIPSQDDIDSNFLVHKMALVPHTTTKFMMTLSPRGIEWENGAGFEIYVPEISGASVLEEIANSNEPEDSSEAPEDSETPDTPDGSDKPSGSIPGSSGGGGCTMGFGAFALIVLSGLALKIRKGK